MRVELHEAIRALSQYLSSDTAYPFLVAANASSDLKELVRALPTRVHTVSMSDYCADDSLPDEDAVFNDLLNAGKPILLKGVGEQIMLSGNTTFLRRIAGQPFPQKIIVLCRNQGTELEHLQQQNTKFGSNRWCELCSSSDVSIVRVNTSVPIDSISGFKALLRKLEDHPAGKLYVKTEIPIICSGVHMRFPTDMKLLWESLEWLYRQICLHCRDLGIRRPRNKYADVAKSYLSYCKKRKRKASRTRMLKRRMIRLLEKLLIQRDEIHREHGTSLRYTQDYQKRLSIIRKVLVQEKELFEGRKVRDRIVSIDRHYVRPIVRGKETKSVEFGAKVNNIQIDGISFIEHLSFKAFNEGIRLKDCIRMQQKLMNVRVRCVAADSIYANNANRKFCTKYGISTSFVRKGRAARDESLRKVLRSELSKERATRLEGSFGTQKQHYSLSRIKARNRKTEILWIFFGIHTANAILMIDKVRNRALKAA